MYLSGIAFDSSFDVDAFRTRLSKMNDKDLIALGKNLTFLCSPAQNFGKPPREVWAIQLKEAREEWRRRHPKAES